MAETNHTRASQPEEHPVPLPGFTVKTIATSSGL